MRVLVLAGLMVAATSCCLAGERGNPPPQPGPPPAVYRFPVPVPAPATVRTEAVPFRLIPDEMYAAFVKNWDNDDRPFCAIVRSQGEWDRVFSPARAMGNRQPSAPEPGFFTREFLLVVSVVGPAAGGNKEPLTVTELSMAGNEGRLVFRYDAPRRQGGHASKNTILIAVPKEYQRPFRFIEEREVALAP